MYKKLQKFSQKFYVGSMLPELCRPRYPSTKKIRPMIDIEPTLRP